MAINPFAGLDLSRQPHALQLARSLDQQRAVLTERVAHVLVGAQVGELPPLLLCDQHPVEPGEAIGIHFPLKLLRYLQLGLPAQLQRNDLAGALANAVGNIVAGDIEGLAVLSHAAHEDIRHPGGYGIPLYKSDRSNHLNSPVNCQAQDPLLELALSNSP